MTGRFLRFAVVGALGYALNLSVYAALAMLVGIPYLPAAVASFGVAVSHNYLLNRAWTFRDARGALVAQGARFFTVAVGALALNLLLLQLFVSAGAPGVLAQALAVALAVPVNFLGNRLWSFRMPSSVAAPPGIHAPAIVSAPRAVVCLPTYN